MEEDSQININISHNQSQNTTNRFLIDKQYIQQEWYSPRSLNFTQRGKILNKVNDIEPSFDDQFQEKLENQQQNQQNNHTTSANNQKNNQLETYKLQNQDQNIQNTQKENLNSLNQSKTSNTHKKNTIPQNLQIQSSTGINTNWYSPNTQTKIQQGKQLQSLNDIDPEFDNNYFDSMDNTKKTVIKQAKFEQKQTVASTDYKSFTSAQKKKVSIKEIIQATNKNFEQNKSKFQKQKTTKVMWKFTQLVLILTYTVSFISKTKKKIQGIVAVKNLNKHQLQLIDDKSHFNLIQDQQNVSKHIKEKENINCLYIIILKILHKIPVISPNKTFKILCDCWMSYWVVFRMFFSTIRLVFFIDNMKGSTDIVKGYTLLIINVSFLFDMFLSIHTGYYDNGLIILDRKKIAIRYMKQTFIYDVMAYIPSITSYLINANSSDTLIVFGFFIELFIFWKTKSLVQIFIRLERVITENEKIADFWPLVRLIVQVLLLAHLVGLIYFGLAQLQIYLWEEEYTWIHNEGLIDESWFMQYLYCIYWSISTMVSNIVYNPITKTELIFSILMIMMMTGIFGYVLNTIGMILSEIEKKTQLAKLQRQLLNRYMKKQKLTENLRERLSLYLDYIQSQKKTRNKEEEVKVLNLVSDQLKREILQEVNQKNISKFKAIENNYSQMTLNETLLIIDEEDYSAGEIIFKQNNFTEEYNNSEIYSNIYFLVKGSIEFYYDQNHSNEQNQKQFIIGEIQEGQTFGEYEFFTGFDRIFNARALQTCTILKIARCQFLEIVQKNEEDYQKFNQMKDELIYLKQTQNVDITCTICDQKQHFPMQCNKLNYQKDLRQLIYDYSNFDIQIKRRECVRPSYETYYSSLGDIEFVQIIVQEIIEDLQEDNVYQWYQETYLFNDIQEQIIRNNNQKLTDKKQNTFLQTGLNIQQQRKQSQNNGRMLTFIPELEEIQQEKRESVNPQEEYDYNQQQNVFQRQSLQRKLTNNGTKIQVKVPENGVKRRVSQLGLALLQQQTNMSKKELYLQSKQNSKQIQNQSIQQSDSALSQSSKQNNQEGDDQKVNINSLGIAARPSMQISYIQPSNSKEIPTSNNQNYLIQPQGQNILAQSTIQKGNQGLRKKQPSSNQEGQLNQNKNGKNQIQNQYQVGQQSTEQFMQLDLDKMKNWTQYLERNNFNTIKHQIDIKQFFVQTINNESSQYNSSLNSQFDAQSICADSKNIKKKLMQNNQWNKNLNQNIREGSSFIKKQQADRKRSNYSQKGSPSRKSGFNSQTQRKFEIKNILTGKKFLSNIGIHIPSNKDLSDSVKDDTESNESNNHENYRIVEQPNGKKPSLGGLLKKKKSQQQQIQIEQNQAVIQNEKNEINLENNQANIKNNLFEIKENKYSINEKSQQIDN